MANHIIEKSSGIFLSYWINMTLFKKRLKICISKINEILFLLLNKEVYCTEQLLEHVLVFVLVNFLDLLSLQYLVYAILRKKKIIKI
jgi:hypothetical protein